VEVGSILAGGDFGGWRPLQYRVCKVQTEYYYLLLVTKDD